MALSYLLVAWLNDLARRGILPDGSSLIEFGPQDLTTGRRAVERIAHDRGHPDLVEKIFNDQQPKPNCQSDFYSLFGVTHYKSIDPFDQRADYKADLNFPFQTERRYDLLTNFGTSEHVFNVAQLFSTVHELLKLEGIALHVLPAYGDINHGFYNFHPVFFDKLAEANRYEIVDFRYVDDIGNRTAPLERQLELEPYRHPAMSTGALSDYLGMRKAFFRNFVGNAASADTLAKPEDEAVVFDYIFVALRKTADTQFAYPNQYSEKGVHGIAASTYSSIKRSPLAMSDKFFSRLLASERLRGLWRSLRR